MSSLMPDAMWTGHMIWGMGIGMSLVALLVILAVIALVKYIAFR